MNRRKASQYQMLTSVRSTLTSHEPNETWTEVPALVKALGQLDTVITDMTDHFETLAVPTGSAAGKRSALEELVGATHEIAAAIHAYADDAGDAELAAQTDFSASDLADGSASEVVARCAKISSIAAANLDSLAEQNVTQAKLTALDKKVSAFQKLAPKPREGVAKRAAANKEVTKLYAKGRRILTRQVDRLMVPFKESAPEFYAEYKSSRKIVNQAATQPARKAAKNKVVASSINATTSKAA